MTQEDTSLAGNGSLLDNLLPDWETDHEGFNFGDAVILIFDLVLLIYTGWRSFDLLSNTVPDGYEIMALIGLWGLDIGAVVWSYIWIFNSSTRWQDRVAMTFWVIDMAGVVLTSITDSLLYGDAEGAMFKMIEPIAMFLIPLIIIGNVIAGFIYHFTSDNTKSRRRERRMTANARAAQMRTNEDKAKMYYAQQDLLNRQQALERKVLLAKMKVKIDAIERASNAALNGQAHVDQAMDEMGMSAGDDNFVPMSKMEEMLAGLKEMGAALPKLGKKGADETLAAKIGEPVHADEELAQMEEQIAKSYSPADRKATERALQEQSIQKAIEDALQENPDADRNAIEQALRGQMTLPNGTVINPFMSMPKLTTKHVPLWIFFRTNSPKHLIRTDQMGENVEIVTGVPTLLNFNRRPPFFVIDKDGHEIDAEKKVKNILVPRYDQNGELNSPFFVLNGAEKEPLQITDWRNTAAIPVGNDIWGSDPYADPTEAGAEN